MSNQTNINSTSKYGQPSTLFGRYQVTVEQSIPAASTVFPVLTETENCPGLRLSSDGKSMICLSAGTYSFSASYLIARITDTDQYMTLQFRYQPAIGTQVLMNTNSIFFKYIADSDFISISATITIKMDVDDSVLTTVHSNLAATLIVAPDANNRSDIIASRLSIV